MNTVWSWQFDAPHFVDLFSPFLLTLEVKSAPVTHSPTPHFPSRILADNIQSIFCQQYKQICVHRITLCTLSGASHTHLDKQTRPSPIQTKLNLGAQNLSLVIKFKLKITPDFCTSQACCMQDSTGGKSLKPCRLCHADPSSVFCTSSISQSLSVFNRAPTAK